MQINDIYQERYLKHQERKSKLLTNESFSSYDFKKYNKKEVKVFFEVVKNRCSQRNFTKEDIDIEPILEAVKYAPSSCGRKGVCAKVIKNRDEKDLLSGLLVGGIGWINRANTILLLIADMNCYKNPAEKDFMPYLDAGVLIEAVYLASEVLNYGCCFINPNIRQENKDFFKQRLGIKDNELFCGALALGKYKIKHTHDILNEKSK